MQKRYIGTKKVLAQPAVRYDKDNSRVFLDHQIPSDYLQNPNSEEGYAVVYEDGYKSWSPKAVFEEAYRETDGMTFGLALEAIQQGHKCARAGWNGKGMFIAYSPGSKDLPADRFWSPANKSYVESLPTQTCDVLPCITFKTATGEILMGWLASQTDMLATDWAIIG